MRVGGARLLLVRRLSAREHRDAVAPSSDAYARARHERVFYALMMMFCKMGRMARMIFDEGSLRDSHASYTLDMYSMTLSAAPISPSDIFLFDSFRFRLGSRCVAF
jgi:hypothetical protein